MPPKKTQTKDVAAKEPTEAGASPVAELTNEAFTSKEKNSAKADGASKKRKAPISSKSNKVRSYLAGRSAALRQSMP